MEYCFLDGVGAPICYLDMLDKPQKWVWSTVGPSVAAFLQLNPHWNVTSSSHFSRYFFDRCLSELSELALLAYSYSCGRSTCYSDRLHDFSVIGIIHDYCLKFK